MQKPTITLVVAMNPERVIGVNNKLPWHIPEDLQYFKQVTLGKPIIMGRKTYDSIGRVLPGRKNIVISAQSDLEISGVSVYPDLNAAIVDNAGYPELCIIGGGEIFKQALPLADKLHVTLVKLKIDNPAVFFPVVNWEHWLLFNKKTIVSNGIECIFQEFIKRGED